MNYLKVNRNKLSKLDKSYQYELLHTRIHILLNHFINLEFLDPKEKLKIGISKNFKINNLGVSRLKEVIEFFNYSSKGEFKVDLAGHENPISFFRTLINLNKIVSSELKKIKEIRKEIVNTKLFNKNKYLSLPEVINFHKETSKISKVKDIFIQGSLATLDYTKFSDFDTFIILNKELEENPEEIIDVIYSLFKNSIYLYRFDPYQHHRYFVSLESNLSIYNQSFLPTEVLKYAVSFKNNTYNFGVYDSNLSLLLFITGPINYFIKHINNNFKEIKNLWHLKYFISTIFFLPVLFLEVNDIYVYKRESFKLIKNHLPNTLNKFLDNCSKLRKDWNYSLNFQEKLFRKSTLNSAYRNSILYEYLMKNFSQKFDKYYFEKVLKGSIPYTEFFYKHILKEFQKRNLL